MVLGKKEMASLLTDVHKGESLIEINHNQFSSDSMRRVMKQSVLDAHGVTQQQWDSSLSYYGRNIEQYIELYDIVIAGLEQELKNVNSRVNSMFVFYLKTHNILKVTLTLCGFN